MIFKWESDLKYLTHYYNRKEYQSIYSSSSSSSTFTFLILNIIIFFSEMIKIRILYKI